MPLILDCTDVNDAYDIFEMILQNSIKESTVVRKPSKNKTLGKPWQSTQLNRLIKEKYRLINKKKVFGIDETERLRLRYLNRHVRVQVKAEKERYYCNQFAEAFRDTKKQWSLINELTGKKRLHKEIEIEEIDCDELPNKFNQFFSNIPLQLKEKLTKPTANHPFHKIFEHPRVSSTLFLSPVDKEEVEDCIKSLKNSKSHGVDNIPIECIKVVSKELSPFLAHMINLSFVTGTFPFKLKVAAVIPIFKGQGNRNSMASYRPISILNVVSKIFEKMMLIRLNSFLSKNSVISQNQYGFLKGKNTEDALKTLSDHVFTSLNNDMKTSAVFLDISRAFDSVNHT